MAESNEKATVVNSFETELTDQNGKVFVLGVSLPLVDVDSVPIYEFQDTSNGVSTGRAILQLVMSESGSISKEQILGLGVKHLGSFSRVARNINDNIFELVRFNPFEVVKEEYSPRFIGVRFHTFPNPEHELKLARQNAKQKRKLDQRENGSVDIGEETLRIVQIERIVIETLKNWAGTNYSVDGIIDLVKTSSGHYMSKEETSRALGLILERTKLGEIEGFQYQQINGEWRFQWAPLDD